MGPIFHEQNAISPFQSTAYCENKDLKVVVHVYRVEMNGFYRTPDIWRGNHTFATKRSEISPIKLANLLTITTTPKNWNNRKELTPTSRSFYTRKGLWVDNSNGQRDLFFIENERTFHPLLLRDGHTNITKQRKTAYIVHQRKGIFHLWVHIARLICSTRLTNKSKEKRVDFETASVTI